MELNLHLSNYKMIYKILKSFVEEHGNYVEVDLTDFTYALNVSDIDNETNYQPCDKWVKTDEYFCTICLNEDSNTPITVQLVDGCFGFGEVYEIPFWATIRITNECLEFEWLHKKPDRSIRVTIKDKQLNTCEV